VYAMVADVRLICGDAIILLHFLALLSGAIVVPCATDAGKPCQSALDISMDMMIPVQLDRPAKEKHKDARQVTVCGGIPASSSGGRR
jgi:hypothetical protein